MDKIASQATITPSCRHDKGWCIQGIFIESSGQFQLIYRRETTKLVAFSGLVFNYCPMCGRRLEEIL